MTREKAATPVFSAWCLSLVALLLAVACGDNGALDEARDTTPVDQVGDDVIGPSDLSPSDRGASEVDPPSGDAIEAIAPPDLDFTIAFSYLSRIGGGEVQDDLWLMRGDGGVRHSLTAFIQDAPDGAGFSCSNRCILDYSLGWLAVATGPRATDGSFEFALGYISDSLEVEMAKFDPLQGLTHLRFGQNHAYYTKEVQGVGGKRQYEVWRLPVEPPFERKRLFSFPPEDRLADSMFGGRFTTNRNGDELLFLLPTPGSQTAYSWNEGVLQELGTICVEEINGVCISEGSQYSDSDPAAISPDGRYVAAFVVRKHDLRLYLWDLTRPEQPYDKRLAGVGFDQVYTERTVCQYLEEGQPAFVRGRPHFTPDSNALLFLGGNECNACDPAKPESDIFKLEVARIMDPTPLQPGELTNVTKTPKTCDAHQLLIEEFDISPAGDALVMSASPMYGPGEQIMGPNERRHRADREIWVQRIDDHRWRRQLTDEVSFRAASPQALPPVEF